ncbi:MAG: GAF domain-containing protein [Pseudomonadota bacterium]
MRKSSKKPARLQNVHADHVRAVALSNSAAAESPLAASWARSFKHYGLIPELRRPKHRITAARLRVCRESLGGMLRISAPIMDRLNASVGLSGCSVFLCDSNGIVLDQRTPLSDDHCFRDAGLWSGAVWSEASEGTNGIGTCIAEKRSVTVYQNQHFHDSNTIMSCMGAPIFDENGRLAAVLDVSSCRADMTPSMAQMISQLVTEGARQIEADHFHSVFAGKRILRGSMDGRRGAVLLAVDGDDLVIGATRGARKCFGLTREIMASPRPVGDILGDSCQRGVGLEYAEKREVRRAIARTKGNMALAAKALGISRATLYRRIERLGLSRSYRNPSQNL